MSTLGDTRWKIREFLGRRVHAAFTPPPLPGTWEGPLPRVRLETSLGEILVELDPLHAPLTVANFLAYVDSQFYDNTLFHRVIRGFVVQGGGMTPELKLKSGTRGGIRNEANNGLLNKRGTLCMARGLRVHGATSQFFINLLDNTSLDHGPGGFGYAVFGKVAEGFDVVRAMAAEPVGKRAGMADVPEKDILLLRARRV